MSSDDQQGGDDAIRYKDGGILLNTRLDEIEREQAAAKRRDEEYRETEVTTNRKIAWFTAALVLTSVISGGISIWQARISQDNSRTSIEQLRNFEAVQAARLTFENLKMDPIPEVGLEFHGTVSVTNYGITIANSVRFIPQSGTRSVGSFESAPGEYKPMPDPGGPGLGPGKSLDYEVRAGPIQPVPMQYVINPHVSYVDIFGREHIETACFKYVPDSKSWVTCANLRQSE